MSDNRGSGVPIREDEDFVIQQIQKYSKLTEEALDEVEVLIKRNYPMSSPEVRRVQQRLHDLEVKSNFWRSKLLQYL